MKKPLIITIAAVILLLSIASWLYLLFFGAPQTTGEVFTNLRGSEGQQVTTPATTTNPTTTPQPGLSLTDSPLEQLTLRPVAGYALLPNDRIRYTEQGTGHTYEIHLTDSTERRLTNTTVPVVSRAVFSETGSYVVLISDAGSSRSVVWGGPIGEETDAPLTTTTLPPTADNIVFTDPETLRFTYTTNGVTTLYKVALTTGEQTAVASLPLRDVRVVPIGSDTYVFPKPDPDLEGHLFTLNNQTLTPTNVDAYGLNLFGADNWLVYSYTRNNDLQATAQRRDTGVSYNVPVAVTPEKCTVQLSDLWCAAPINDVPYTYQKQWYQGVIRSNDGLWRINPVSETGTLEMSPENLVGRPLDMTELQLVADTVTFINKLDNTLWRYDAAR